jgi:hypothetical protein
MRIDVSAASVGICMLVSGCVAGPVPQNSSDAVISSTPYRPALDPRSWRDAVVGPKTQVATLGSIHIGELGSAYEPNSVAPLIAKLAAFNPTIITHEGLSGEQCELVQRHEAIYQSIYKDYCWGVEEGAKATGLTLSQARAEAEQLLKTWPINPTPQQRRRLAALFIASGDRPSAQVQWLQLPATERVVGDGIDEAVKAILMRVGARRNETFEIGVTLAVQLGHQRMYAVDDHTADSIQYAAPAGYEAYKQAHWSRPSSAAVPVVVSYGTLKAKANTGDGMLAIYRFLNLPETQRAFVELDYKDSLMAQSPQLFGRRYVAWWEVRNLRMVANIRSAFGNQPGARVLNIVGASHKAYYEAYLEQMSEVELVDIQTILK